MRNLGNELINQGKTEEGYQLFLEAKMLLQTLVQQAPNSPSPLHSLALLYGSFAQYHYAVNAPDLARKAYLKKLDIYRKLYETRPNSPKNIWNLGFCHFQLAELASEEDKFVESLRHSAMANEFAKRLSDGPQQGLQNHIKNVLDSIFAKLFLRLSERF